LHPELDEHVFVLPRLHLVRRLRAVPGHVLSERPGRVGLRLRLVERTGRRPVRKQLGLFGGGNDLLRRLLHQDVYDGRGVRVERRRGSQLLRPRQLGHVLRPQLPGRH
jgi:hypothetical protein